MNLNDLHRQQLDEKLAFSVEQARACDRIRRKYFKLFWVISQGAKCCSIEIFDEIANDLQAWYAEWGNNGRRAKALKKKHTLHRDAMIENRTIDASLLKLPYSKEN